MRRLLIIACALSLSAAWSPQPAMWISTPSIGLRNGGTATSPSCGCALISFAARKPLPVRMMAGGGAKAPMGNILVLVIARATYSSPALFPGACSILFPSSLFNPPSSLMPLPSRLSSSSPLHSHFAPLPLHPPPSLAGGSHSLLLPLIRHPLPPSSSPQGDHRVQRPCSPLLTCHTRPLPRRTTST